MKSKSRIQIFPLLMVFLLLISASCSKKDGNANTVVDIDGNQYKTVVIGSQTWMSENLKTTKYNDGTPIPNVTDQNTWDLYPWLNVIDSTAYCWQNNAISNKDTYGALYNWYAVNTGKLAPKGWHVPSEAEWTTLITFVGGSNTAGSNLKEKGTTHWLSPNDATNGSGFTALPGGGRDINGFNSMNEYGFWWCSTDEGSLGGISASNITLINNIPRAIEGGGAKVQGLSVRCIKD